MIQFFIIIIIPVHAFLSMKMTLLNVKLHIKLHAYLQKFTNKQSIFGQIIVNKKSYDLSNTIPKWHLGVSVSDSLKLVFLCNAPQGKM